MTETSGFDLNAYLSRIGFSGDAAPTLETLRSIHRLHPGSIAFDGIDPFVSLPVRLDLGSVQAKLVGRRRGGYCFEQNTLLMAALQAIGFETAGLIARVCWMAPPDQPPTPRTHMLLRVDLPEGVWLADVGFGGHLILGPLALQVDVEQDTGASIQRLRRSGDVFTLQTHLPDGWRDCYAFTLEPAYAADYEVGNWYTSTHPASRFRTALLLERLTPEVRYSLFDRRLTIRRPGEDAEVRELADAAAVRCVPRAPNGAFGKQTRCCPRPCIGRRSGSARSDSSAPARRPTPSGGACVISNGAKS